MLKKIHAYSLLLLILSLCLILPVMAEDEGMPQPEPQAEVTAPEVPSAPAENAVEAPAQELPQAQPESKEPAVQAEMDTEAPPPESGLRVGKMVVCIDIQEREPVGAGTMFPATTGQVYCHSLILGAEEETIIHHVWYWNDQKMADVPLTVRSQRFRTYSSKKILPQWKGAWRVELTGPDGALLSTAAFNIE